MSSSLSSSVSPHDLLASQNCQNLWARSGIFFFMDEFQWFLIELSVRPSRYFAISAHLLPLPSWNKKRIHSSSSLHTFFLIRGFKWLCHLSRHCFPIHPGRCSAIAVHFQGPAFSTRRVTSLSSKSVHGPFINLGLSTFCHLCKHWTSVLPLRHVAIFFQLFPLYFLTASSSNLSSSQVQWPLLDFLMILLWIQICLPNM